LITSDFVVVGGGIAGVAVAAALADNGSVILMERETQLAMHATGRSAAALLPSYGTPVVQALTRLSAVLMQRTEEEDQVRILRRRPLLRIASREQSNALATLVSSAPSLKSITTSEAIAMCPALRQDYVYSAAVESEAADVDVMTLYDSYVRRIISAGSKVLLGHELLAGQFNKNTWTLDASEEIINTPVVVNAAGAWCDTVSVRLGGVALGLRPKRRTVAVAAKPNIPRTWPLTIDAAETFYFRPYQEGVLISPADETDHHPGDAQADPVDVATALSRVNRATNLNLRSVLRSWAGLRTFAKDRLPIVGFDPKQPAAFWVSGQGGYGIQASPGIALLSASLITGLGPCVLVDQQDIDVSVLSPSRFS